MIHYAIAADLAVELIARGDSIHIERRPASTSCYIALRAKVSEEQAAFIHRIASGELIDLIGDQS